MSQQTVDGATSIGIKLPTSEELTNRNKTDLNLPSMPNLSVYIPDYGSLQASFDQIMASYDQYKNAAQASADAQKSALQSSLEQQMQTIDTTRTENRQQAAQNRAQIQEQSFMQQRATERAASARGLGGSGVEALAQIQNRMATGEAISEMSNEYFDAQQQLVEAEANARTNYDNSMQNLNASLQSTMAQIMSQEASSRMDYAQTVDALKRQVVADQNAVAQAQYEWEYAKSQLDQGAQINDAVIYQGMVAAAGDTQAQMAFLQSIGMTPAEANLYALQFNNKQASTTLSKQQADYAMLKARGYSSDEINTYMDNTYGVTGWDPAKMSTATTTTSTRTTTVTPSQNNLGSLVGGYLPSPANTAIGTSNLGVTSSYQSILDYMNQRNK